MIKLFGEVPFKKVEITILKNLESKIESINDNEILNSDLKILMEKQVSKSKLKKLEVNFEKRKHKIEMKMIKGRELPPGFDVRPDEDTSRAKVSYSFPLINGEVELFSSLPKNAYISKPIIGNASSKEITINFQTTCQSEILESDIENEIIVWRDISIIELKAAVEDINLQVDNFNESLIEKAEEQLNKKYIIAKKKRDQGNKLE